MLTESSLANGKTPEKYCASLPAVSCEVLNLEPLGCASYCMGVIKYCRNQKLQFMPFNFNAVSATQTNFYIIDNTGSMRTIGTTSGQIPTVWNTTQLCGYMP